MAVYGQNTHYPKNQVPSYYANNKVYGRGAYARTDWPTRASRRVHEGLSLTQAYGLDTTSDDVSTSPYSSPYYVNGRYNSGNTTTQRGNSSSVEGIKFLASFGDITDDFKDEDIQTHIKLWQGKQIKFEIPYNGKVVGQTLTLKNTKGCRGILSVYISASDGGKILSETAIDLCKVSQDNFEHKVLRTMTPILRTANPRGKLYVRMEIWEDLDCKRSTNPFNTGRYIEIAATGAGSHQACVYELGEKNLPVNETYDYTPHPNRPCMGLIYNNLTSVPVNRIEGVDLGATISVDGYSYDLFAYKDENSTYIFAFDRRTKDIIPTKFPVSGNTTGIYLVQAENYVYYVDGTSPLHRFEIGNWDNYYEFPISTVDSVSVNINNETWVNSGIAEDSGVFIFFYANGAWQYENKEVSLDTYGISVTGTPAEGAEIKVTYIAATPSTEIELKAEYYDTRPVLAPSIITLHNNRIYLSGFAGDPNLVQFSRITEKGPDFNSYPYRFYVPDQSPKATSTNPITAIIETASDEIMIELKNGYTRFNTNSNAENELPQQISSYSDGAGVASQGDICSYRGIVYSFDPDEGIRYFAGTIWKKVAGQNIMTLWERVDMNRPRKMWGYAYKLYFNYYDIIDGKAKCIVYDMEMSSQQYPFFQDVDIPFCDIRANDDFDLVGIHPDYPCIMQLYAQDTWSRLDTPIVFERWSKYLSLPGNAADMILRRVHIKVIANTTRWWNFGIAYNQHSQTQTRGKTITYRQPSWDTIDEPLVVEDPFNTEPIDEEKGVDLLTLPNLRVRAISVQVKARCKTFRASANLMSVLLETRIRQYD